MKSPLNFFFIEIYCSTFWYIFASNQISSIESVQSNTRNDVDWNIAFLKLVRRSKILLCGVTYFNRKLHYNPSVPLARLTIIKSTILYSLYSEKKSIHLLDPWHYHLCLFKLIITSFCFECMQRSRMNIDRTFSICSHCCGAEKYSYRSTCWNASRENLSRPLSWWLQ